MEKKEGIYNAYAELGPGKTILLGMQHVFAMFGATILVPILTGLNISTTLFFAGIGTLIFHLISKGKVPAFLGSSFAYLGGYAAIAPLSGANGLTNYELLPYACFGVAMSSILYIVMAILIKLYGTKKVMQFFPPIVTGPIIIAIGLTLSSSAIANCSTNWFIALVAIILVIRTNIWGKGMLKIIPIIIGIAGSYLLALILGKVNFRPVLSAPWVGMPIDWDATVFTVLGPGADIPMLITSVITIAPVALATIVEHIGDISAISSTVGTNFIKDPGLHRTLLGDGIATAIASMYGGPANTTYGENTGVLTLTKVYDPHVVRLAALFAMIFSFSPKFAALVGTLPASTIGGVSLVLYGMISAVGVRNIVETRCDFSKTRNVIIAALILVLSIGVNYGPNGALVFHIGKMTIKFSGLAIGALVGIILNAILPGKDYVFDEDNPTHTGVEFAVRNRDAEIQK